MSICLNYQPTETELKSMELIEKMYIDKLINPNEEYINDFLSSAKFKTSGMNTYTFFNLPSSYQLRIYKNVNQKNYGGYNVTLTLFRYEDIDVHKKIVWAQTLKEAKKECAILFYRFKCDAIYNENSEFYGLFI